MPADLFALIISVATTFVIRFHVHLESSFPFYYILLLLKVNSRALQITIK